MYILRLRLNVDAIFWINLARSERILRTSLPFLCDRDGQISPNINSKFDKTQNKMSTGSFVPKLKLLVEEN
jgi:hypothetical protein